MLLNVLVLLAICLHVTAQKNATCQINGSPTVYDCSLAFDWRFYVSNYPDAANLTKSGEALTRP
jgi:hypothetical protein